MTNEGICHMGQSRVPVMGARHGCQSESIFTFHIGCNGECNHTFVLVRSSSSPIRGAVMGMRANYELSVERME